MNRDLLRRLWVTLSAALCVYGTLLGFGVVGTPVEDSSSGALSADATLLAPGSPAFSIWSVIYVGLFAYTVWQWLPANHTAERARATGWLAGASMLLNAGWLLVTQAGLIWLSVAVIAALVIVLGVLVQKLTALPPRGAADTIIVDGTFGAYLGWVCIATCANIAAAGSASGWTLGASGDQLLAVGVLAVAAALGVVLARQLGGRLAPAIALAWGLAWIAIARITDTPASLSVGVAAVVAAVIVLAAALLLRRRAVPALA
ncbi:TspO/MBR family protein [Granulicoccus sp. GXG6511]|uniref:TspO/MBR family protein n=1 Tax=Granulicoccus sp. GXG6511 TaxID=3381351 RepID=UPI003D7D6AB9